MKIGFTSLRLNCSDITVLKNFAIFTGKLQDCNFIKNRLQHRCFLLNIAKCLRTAASVLTDLLSSDNLLTGYEQLSY